MKNYFQILTTAMLFALPTFAAEDSEFIKIGEGQIGFVPSMKANSEIVSPFCIANSDVFLHDAEDAMNMYEGAWNGLQQVYIYGGNDKPIAEATIIQRYVRADFGSEKRLLGTGTMTSNGRSVDIRSIMSIQGKELILEVRDERGNKTYYRGKISQNLVSWEPYCLLFLMDSQNDGFFKTSKGIIMDSSALKYVEFPQQNFKGFFYTRSSLLKSFDAYKSSNVDKMQELKFDGKFK